MIKAILFDLDNTLIDRQASANAMYRQFVMELFPKLSPSSYEFESILQDLMTWDEFGSINKQHPLTMLCTKYNLDLKNVDRLNERWTNELATYTVLYPETEAVLEQLKKHYRLGIITNGHSKSQWQKVKAVNIEHHFEHIIVSGDQGIHKPDVRIFEIMCHQLAVKADECMFIGDTFSTDILGAYNAGMTPVWLCSDLKRAGAPYVKRIYLLKDLLSFV